MSPVKSKKTNQVLLLLLITMVQLSCSVAKKTSTEMFLAKGNYMGQVAPADSAYVFAPHIISTGANERDFTMTPDGKELFFCREVGNFKYNTIFHSYQKDGSWSKPEVLVFCQNPAYLYIEPHVSPDGNKLFFVSNMPCDGANHGTEDIWYSEKINNQWGQPKNIGTPVNTKSKEFFPSVTRDGTIYFTHLDTLAKDESIYRSRYLNGQYQQPEKLNQNVNIGKARFNAFIAPDESFIIVPAFGMPDTHGGTDYYIVFRDANDNWSKPLNMGAKINSENPKEWSASLSPDGKYLFFMSARLGNNRLLELSRESMENFHLSPQNGNTDIYWINSSIIEELRTKAEF